MADLHGVSITPNTLPLGGQATVTLDIGTDPGNSGRTVNVRVEVDGDVGAGPILIGKRDPETVYISTDPSDIGKPGVCVVTVDEGSLSILDYRTLRYTAPAV